MGVGEMDINGRVGVVGALIGLVWTFVVRIHNSLVEGFNSYIM